MGLAVLGIERPDSSLRLEYPSPKLGLGLESEYLWTRDPNESKITVEMGKKQHFLAFRKINFLYDYLMIIDLW